MLYKTARGRQIDMQSIIAANEKEIAVGNAGVNARGDRLGPGGKIIQTREELSNAHYNKLKGNKLTDLPNAPVVQQDIFAIKPDQEDDSNFVPEATIPEIDGLPDPHAEALAKSQALAERLKQQRKLQQDEQEKNQ